MVLVSHAIREASLLFNRELVSTWIVEVEIDQIGCLRNVVRDES
jgi:hypothetical protein